jgi:catechol-2,3-dioxygenase
MRIKELHLYTRDLHAQRAFYTRTLGLPLVAETTTSFTIQAGETLLVFERTRQTAPIYHIAFTIPANKIIEAKAWLESQTPSVPLLSQGGQDTFYGKTWNVDNIYFYDATGNILEFIGHRDLPAGSSESFSERDVLRISEIGMAFDDVVAQVNAFKERLGIMPYKGESSDTFTAMGDIYGLFIVVKTGRSWFPTEADAAGLAPVEVTIEGAEDQHYHIAAYPYEIEVVQ